MDAVFYWDMTYAEIQAFIEGNQAREKAKLMNQASLIHNLGYLMAYSFHSPKAYPKMNEAFPGLFDELVKEQHKTEQWEINKARMQAYADEHNAKIAKSKDRKG